MSAPTVRGVGVYGSGTTSFTAAVPTGGSAPVSGDALYIIMESTDSTTTAGTPSTPAGWTSLFEQTFAAGSSTEPAVSTLTVFGKIAGAGEANVTVNGVGNHCSGAMVVVAGHGLSSITATAIGTATDHGTTTTSVNTASLTVTGNSLIIGCIGLGDDANDTTNVTAGPTNTNLASITLQRDQTVNTGSGGGVAIWTATCAGTTTGTTAWTHDTAAQSESLHIAIPPLMTAAVTGTITSSVDETHIVAGGKTLIITLTDGQWIAAGAGSFDLQRDEIIAGCDSAQSETLGWDLVPKALQSLGGVARTSNTVVTITWDAFATYNITANEMITVTVPSTAVVGGVAAVATPTFTVAFTASFNAGWASGATKLIGTGVF